MLIVEFTPSSIRGLRVARGGWRPRAAQLFVEPLGARPAAEALAALVKRVGATPARVVSVIPREQIMTRMMHVPATDPDELRRIVELSGRTQFPYPAHKMLVDFHVARQDNAASTVQLVGCRREVIEQHLAQLREAGVEPETITPSSWGILGWYRKVRASINGIEPVCVVNVDADHTELVVIQDERLLFSRVLGEEPSQWQGELKRTLSGARQDWPELEINTCVLTGVGPLDHYRAVIEEHLGASVVVRQAAEGWGMASRTQEAVSPVVVLGLGSVEPDRAVNLLPGEARRLHAKTRLIRAGLRTAWVGMAACWLIALLFAAQAHRDGMRLALLRMAHTRLEAVARELQDHERYVRVAARVVQSRKQSAERLAALMRVTPTEVSWKNVALDHSGDTMVVAGSAPTTRRVLDYVHALQEAKLWDTVELRYASRRSMKTERRTEFEIALHRGVKG